MSGALNQNLGSFMGQTAPRLPLAFYAARGCSSIARSDRRAAGLAFAYATTALASFPPLLLAIFGLTALYFLVAITVSEDGPHGPGAHRATLGGRHAPVGRTRRLLLWARVSTQPRSSAGGSRAIGAWGSRQCRWRTRSSCSPPPSSEACRPT